MPSNVILSQEQEHFIEEALAGHDVLVDACIGSGKTTAIQALCNRMPFMKQVVYLTYNKLLKADARSKIRKPNVLVTNYHGFAYTKLYPFGYHGPKAGVGELIREFNRKKPSVGRVDILVLDEYQDMESEMTGLLETIREQNPSLQVVAVGDMRQKIYDKTDLDVLSFLQGFLKPDHKEMEFSVCFRLGQDYASGLGGIWGRRIEGANPDFTCRSMDYKSLVKYLSGIREPGKLLVLGPNTGHRVGLQNKLEHDFPDVYNKRTLWSSITDGDSEGVTEPDGSCSVFCTFDKSKGMERDICVVCGWTEDYWNIRLGKPYVKYEILRNMFLVAASRGKREVIFLDEGGNSRFLSQETLSRPRGFQVLNGDISVHDMLSFKIKEHLDRAVGALDRVRICPAGDVVPIRNRDGYVDLSPCLGVYQECSYFEECRIERYIEEWFALHPDDTGLRRSGYEKWDLDTKVLYYASLEVGQMRYQEQVDKPLVTEAQKEAIHGRLSGFLPPDASCQVECHLDFYNARSGLPQFCAKGFADAVHGGAVWELKFVSALQDVHFLQCACYMVMLGMDTGFLFNTMSGELWRVRIPDRKTFLDRLARVATKGTMGSFHVTPRYKDMLSPSVFPDKRVLGEEFLGGGEDIPRRKALVLSGHIFCGRHAVYDAILDLDPDMEGNVFLYGEDALPYGVSPEYACVSLDDNARMGRAMDAGLKAGDICRKFLDDEGAECPGREFDGEDTKACAKAVLEWYKNL